MKLIDALQIIRSAHERSDTRRFVLATGFTPLHLGTFLTAALQERLAAARVDLDVGQFGDLPGNVRRTASSGAAGLAVVVEWQDLDPRLGLRQNGGWGPTVLDDVLATARSSLARLAVEVEAVALRMPVALCPPTLPLAPIAFTPGTQASAFELQLRAAVAQFVADVAVEPAVRVVNDAALSAASLPTTRLSVKSDLNLGFPYTQPHAAAVAARLAALLLPRAPKKGLVTDLDDTVWLGILGDVGTAGVAWDLEHHAQLHGLYQQLVASLADSGVLVAVASKNDESLVEEAFRRPDLALPRDHIFPLLANWGPKSSSIDTVLQSWNVGADSLVFVDDSPIEIAEVKNRHPDVECRLFPKNDPDAVLALLHELRDLFGRPAIQAEDAIRRESLRAAQARTAATTAAGHDEEAFAASLGATITFAVGSDAADARAFELINKTNQFNVNGRRSLESEWADLRTAPNAAVLTVSYADKFGPLGKIAVVAGRVEHDGVHVERWVLSCRAFARRIEYATLRALFDLYDVEDVFIEYEPTPRNTPVRDFLSTFIAVPDQPTTLRISRAAFDAGAPALYHHIERSAIPEPANG